MYPTQEIYVIYCRTGCTCCASNNHYRGFYKTKEDAIRRINYYKSPNSKYWPLSSQYAKRGVYEVLCDTLEDLQDGRYIVADYKVLKKSDFKFIEVNKDGTICNDEDELISELNS